MDDHQRALVDAIQADASSSATDLLLRAAELLLTVADDRAALRQLARACARAQPTMAGLITLERVASGSADPGAAIAQFQAQVRHAPAAIARHAVALLLLRPEPRASGRPALRIVTCSYSRAVEATILALGREADVTVCCAESRPEREGVRLAASLAAAGLHVELFSDAGISISVPGADALLVGADAIGPDLFVNKAGTGALCALAQATGVPAYALAGREKVLSEADLARLILVEGLPSAVSNDAGVGIRVRNPYFERVPISLLSSVVTDGGVRAVYE